MHPKLVSDFEKTETNQPQQQQKKPNPQKMGKTPIVSHPSHIRRQLQFYFFLGGGQKEQDTQPRTGEERKENYMVIYFLYGSFVFPLPELRV